MPAAPEFDVFLWYVRADEQWARRLHGELMEEGMRVFFDQASLPLGEPWSDTMQQALETSSLVVVLWSPEAREARALDQLTGQAPVVAVDLGGGSSEWTTVPLADDPKIYAAGPDAVEHDGWRALAVEIQRIARRAAAPELKLSSSVRALTRRLPGDVSGRQIVASLISTHPRYAGGQGASYDLGPDTDASRRQPVEAWIAEASAFFAPAQQPELHGRQLILGIGLAEPALGRRMLETGLFGAIDAELGERLDTVLTDAGHAARSALAPVPLAGYVADNLLGDDMLGLRADVQALCAVVCADAVKPPLSIGLFGPWGSGKSFFMQLMRKEITRVATRAQRARVEGRDDPFCEHVVQIEFNAWHYLDANLWASLMARIWEGLAAHGGGTADAPDPRYQALLKQLESSSALLREAERTAEDAEQRASAARDKLDELARDRAEAGDALAALSARDVAAEVADDESVRDAIAAVEREAGLPERSLSVADLPRLAADLRGAGRVRALWRMLKGRRAWRRAILALGAGLLALGLALLFARAWIESAVAAVVALLGIVGAAGRTLSPALKPTAALLGAIDAAVERANQAGEQREAEIAKAEREERARLISLEEEVAVRRSDLLVAEERHRDAEQAIKEIETGRAAARFIAERAASADYVRHLGLIALIQRDLATLSRLLAPPDDVPPPADGDGELPQIDRIVLYIDDLDRCPAHLVVEVLQAVHLLLAYPLFVVVVGVDPRWLVSSLSRHHTAMLGPEAAAVPGKDEQADWTARPLEYLEKIFQLPLILKPMEQAGYARLVRELLPLRASASNGAGLDDDAPTTDADGGSGAQPIVTGSGGEDFDRGHTALEIEPAELALVEQLWPLMPSPRAVKRLSNVYRFLRAQVPPGELRAFTGEVSPPGDFPAVLMLLAVLVGRPDDAPVVLRAVCTSGHGTWGELLSRGVGVPESAKAPLRDATKGYEDYPLERVAAWVPRVTRFSFSFWDMSSAQPAVTQPA